MIVKIELLTIEGDVFICIILLFIVATTRRPLLSDSGAFVDWAISSSTAIRAGPDDLSLGFNANASAAAAVVAAAPESATTQWPPSAGQINYGLPSETGMVGRRDFVFVAPASYNHHHHYHHHLHYAQDPIIGNDQINGHNVATALGVGVGTVFPLLTASPCVAPQNMEDSDLLNNNGRNKLTDLIQSSGGGGAGSSSGTTCLDCGNHAKKDCTHRRCRTCCKSRGFDCLTHVKSTWVPAARRRERQLMAAAAATGGGGSSASTSGGKKPRLVISQTTNTHTSTSNTTSRSFDTNSSHKDAWSLPGQVRAPAVFKCVRVTAVEDGEDEYAYQAVARIGRRVFKGFLYDQGIEGRDGFPNKSELQLGGGGGSSGG
ncbi:protein LATERAL ROOT PRIMORDIUM 1-like [Hibiscus syriacus]|uniref:protein LATERAL ROOT PRIMORDIUM 1-like n=1 Tax=Hibiscus syriacus TaxID=106335 RepID=UPI001923F5A9|nr:protein LATERAL ROOT PRIMORDIUM 1-like [Hibiscus syriacus]